MGGEFEELTRGPLLKVERAKQHINDLNRQTNEFLARRPFELRVQQTKNPPRRVIYVKSDPPVPEHFSLIVGDAVHNLRAALDHLCFAMVGDKAQEKSRARIGFPFAKRGGEGLSGAIATRQMNLAPKHVVDELHSLKPYASGHKYLFAVSALDERDKHHFILTVGVGISMTMDWILHALYAAEPLGDLINIDPKTVIATVGGFGRDLNLPLDDITDLDEKFEVQPTFTIGFGQEEFLVCEPVIVSLKNMAAATEDAIDRLAVAYLR